MNFGDFQLVLSDLHIVLAIMHKVIEACKLKCSSQPWGKGQGQVTGP